VNHKVPQAINREVQKLPNPVIALEELRGTRERTKGTKKANRMLHSWAFGQLIQFVEYNAATAGIPVLRVDPRKTTRTSTHCGHADRSNRNRQAIFKCQNCRFEIQAYLNGARNIAVQAAQTLASCYVSGAMGLLTGPSSLPPAPASGQISAGNLAGSLRESPASAVGRRSVTRLTSDNAQRYHGIVRLPLQEEPRLWKQSKPED
jgi:IS605 OrfB family transposase